MNYIIVKITSTHRSFLKAMNHGLTSNVNEIEIRLKYRHKILGLFPMLKIG